MVPVVTVAINTDEGPRTITVNDHQDGRITDAIIRQGRPTPEATDIPDRILTHLEGQGSPAKESSILDAVGGDHGAVLRRLTVDGMVEPVGGGRYQIPTWPPDPVNLPDHCPLMGGPVPAGCRFEPAILSAHGRWRHFCPCPAVGVRCGMCAS